MQLQWLKTFSMAAKTLNFRKTSEQLLMSQPSVTVHIKLLEDFLGVSLFDRNKNSVTLTDAGKLFIQKAENLLLQFEESVQTIHAYKQGFRRTWTIAISPLLAETILPYILRNFMKQHPDLEITIRVEESNLIESLVDSGDVHLGISAIDAHSKHLQSIPIFEEPLLFIVPVDNYDDETGPPINVMDCLRTHTLLTHHHPVFWEDVLVLLREHIPGLRTMKVSQAHITKRFIQDGLGISFLPHSIVRRELLEGRLMKVPFDLFELPKVTTYVLVKKQDDLEKEFIHLLSTHYFG
ncbi:LysR family transcriptional regulator [Paenisporosarcina sp. OV554]|uniref:LysR family transcriptional regulator n=1 Tax=Paenisporosarcina sp. OV554 TaxID=2135694 RepID=UPI000D3B98E4|nr:LysR family transcriptional regulator [Paenisporosarcina sp. OV554]PUB08419.1 LysR family transcriptional repressor of citA [Paenisporosarcina sp. OV554]